MEKFGKYLQAMQDLFHGTMNSVTAGLWTNLLQMMNITVGGFSLRKFVALLLAFTAVDIMLRHPGEPNSVTYVFICLGCTLLCLGLITSQQLMEFKGGAQPTASAGPVTPPAAEEKQP